MNTFYTALQHSEGTVYVGFRSGAIINAQHSTLPFHGNETFKGGVLALYKTIDLAKNQIYKKEHGLVSLVVLNLDPPPKRKGDLCSRLCRWVYPTM